MKKGTIQLDTHQKDSIAGVTILLCFALMLAGIIYAGVHQETTQEKIQNGSLKVDSKTETQVHNMFNQ